MSGFRRKRWRRKLWFTIQGGLVNTGGGAGGGGQARCSSNGGSGVVIVAYPTSQGNQLSISGGTTSIVGTKTLRTFVLEYYRGSSKNMEPFG